MFTECPTVVAREIATYLDLASHARLARTSQKFAAVCAHCAASPVHVTLPRPTLDRRSPPSLTASSKRSASPTRAALDPTLDPACTLRHYRPLRLTCSPAAVDGSLDFLAQHPQLLDLELRAPPVADFGADERDDVRERATLDFLAHTPALESLRTEVGCWRRDVVGGTESRLATATTLTELRLTDAVDLVWRDLFGDAKSDRSTAGATGLETMQWAAALSRLEVLELRCAPDLQTFRGLGGDDDDDEAGTVGDDVPRLPSRLRSLEARDIENACDVAPLRSLSALRSLTIGTRSSMAPVVGLANLPVGLRRLRLDTTATNLASLRHLVRLTHLTCVCSGSWSLAPLAELRRLRVLELNRCWSVSSLVGLGSLTRLERLVMTGAHVLGDCRSLAALPRLRALTLTDLWDLDLCVTVPTLRHLTHLDTRLGENTTNAPYSGVSDGALIERMIAARVLATAGVAAVDGGDDDADGQTVAPVSATTVVVDDCVAAIVKIPSTSSVRVFTAAEYDASLGRATHDVHGHALVRRVVRRLVRSEAKGEARIGTNGDDDAADDAMCERCAGEIADRDAEWTCAPCDFHLCERCAAATRCR